MSKFKKIFKIAAPIAAGFIPGIGPLAAGALGAGLGAIGGGGLKGALLGGLGSYVGGGGSFGGLAKDGLGGALGMGSAQTLNKALGGAITGSSQGGKGALTGALLGGIGANAGDIKDYVGNQLGGLGDSVGGQLGDFGNTIDRNLGTSIFAPAQTGNAGIDAYNNVLQSDANPFQGTEYGPQPISILPSGASGGEKSGTSSDAGGANDAAQTGAQEMKFSDILSGVNDYYSQDQMQKEQMDALRRAEAAYSPYMAAGGQGLNELLRGYNPGDLTQDPSYQFRLAEGQKALEKSMAARGMLNSGQAMKAITDYGQNMASTAYDDAYRNWFARNAMLANYGNQNLGPASGIYQKIGAVNAANPYANNSFLNALLAGQYGGF